VPDFGKEA
jgi:S1-C subfamily serine protease/DNA-binding NarL/FixJ family response regulator